MGATDTERLDWMLSHEDAYFQDAGSGKHCLVFWLGPCSAPDGISGKHLAEGASPRECIDNALASRFQRID